uniref:TM1586_NiRdase domain-containing protein n=1 Tax=Heterorhabditis bacteriophora TaxID=37862 RepID=A0A1I7WN67_HETBA
MSSWFSYFKSNLPRVREVSQETEETEDVQETQQSSGETLIRENSSTSSSPIHALSPSASILQAIEDLSQQQKEMIQNVLLICFQHVLRRADQSRSEARVVLDAKRMARLGLLQRGSINLQREFSVEEMDRQDSHEHGELIQMDSLPESGHL